MVKLFLSNDMRSRYLKNPESAWSRLCEKTLPNVTDERLFSNDERELRRRDAAHWISYRYLGWVVIAAFFVAYLKNLLPNAWDSLHVPPAIFDTLIYCLLMAAFVLVFTLPQAILLWTEPDMEAEG
jgi:ABC-type transport system involved in cytochrome bd biosynthesis fused ATPase/permease subunit